MQSAPDTRVAAPGDRSLTAKGKRARDQIVDAAEAQFADHGFHGASMRDLAAAAGLPLATTVYYFARKEQLYGAVLARIAAQVMTETDASVAASGAAAALEQFLLALVTWSVREPRRVRLLLRELLDNPTRVAKASHLPLAPFVERGSALVAAAVQAGHARADHAELAMLHVVGGISYLVAVRPTVARIVGKTRAAELATALETDALTLARRSLGIAEARRGR
jgi:AcrR family transcriptional regulator